MKMAQLVEYCTGITEVMGLNPVQARIFSGFNFITAQVVCITAMINHVFMIVFYQLVKLGLQN